eukprot:tig00000093_g3445.t1
MERYQLLDKIGEGTFGVVLRAKNTETGETVAIKKIRLRKLEDGIPNNVVREVKALQQLEHPNVVKLYEVFPHGAGLVLVFEYMRSDLAEVLRWNRAPLSEAQAKSYMQMLLRGIAACHEQDIMHRDLKPANLLISPGGALKLADFGLARVHLGPGVQYTQQIATRWYRAPESLYGARRYGPGVDLWAAGCIMAELLANSPLFPGENDIDQLYRVVSILGTPDEDSWPGIRELPDYGKIAFPEMPAVPLEQLLPNASPPALALLRRLLVYNPGARPSALDALLDPWFFLEPLPAHPSELPLPAREARGPGPPGGAGGGPGPGSRAPHDWGLDEPFVWPLTPDDDAAAS